MYESLKQRNKGVYEGVEGKPEGKPEGPGYTHTPDKKKSEYILSLTQFKTRLKAGSKAAKQPFKRGEGVIQ